MNFRDKCTLVYNLKNLYLFYNFFKKSCFFAGTCYIYRYGIYVLLVFGFKRTFFSKEECALFCWKTAPEIKKNIGKKRNSDVSGMKIFYFVHRPQGWTCTLFVLSKKETKIKKIRTQVRTSIFHRIENYKCLRIYQTNAMYDMLLTILADAAHTAVSSICVTSKGMLGRRVQRINLSLLCYNYKV